MLLSVPSAAMRGGQLDQSILPARALVLFTSARWHYALDPANVTPSPVAAAVLKYLFPAPNYGAPDDYANNYQINFPSPISANQGDIRLDRTLSSRQSSLRGSPTRIARC